MKKTTTPTVKIENEFVMKAHYSLSAIEQKLILYLASQINPKENKEFHKQVVPIKKLERFLTDENSKWGSIYSYLDNICDKLLTQRIRFEQPVMLNNSEKIFGGGINWFQHILVVENEAGERSIEFMFSNMMKPFLLELNKYVKINALDIIDLRGKYSVRMYQVFKAERERTRAKEQPSSVLTYRIEDLKLFLGIIDKYPTMSNFRRRVLEPMVDEINQHSKEISIKVSYKKHGRKVTHIQFHIFDKNAPKSKENREDYVPSEKDIKTLSNAKFIAYKAMVDYGVKSGIAYKQILPKIKGGESDGFEDLFAKHFLRHFNKWTTFKEPTQKAGAFVKWCVDKNVFSTDSDVFWKINEKVYESKKKMTPSQLKNRVLAKSMPRNQFLKEVSK